MKRPQRLLWSLGLSALMGLMAGNARAGSITLTVDLNGNVIFTATSVAPDKFLQVPTALTDPVNTALAGHGSAYRFTGLSAQSNFAGGALGSLQTTFQLNTSGAGSTAAVLSIDTTQNGFVSPTGPGGEIVSTAGGSFNTATGSLSYTSNFQAVPSPTLVFPVSGTSSYSNTTGTVPVGTVPTGFELSNHFEISLTKGANSFLGGTGGVILTAIPEPASMVMATMGLPLPMVLFGLLRRRKARLNG